MNKALYHCYFSCVKPFGKIRSGTREKIPFPVPRADPLRKAFEIPGGVKLRFAENSAIILLP